MSEKENPLRAEKRRKLHALRASGIDPFPHQFSRTATAAQLLQEFAHLQVGEAAEGKTFHIAGRLMTRRPMGKAAFFNVQDASGSLQGYLRTEELSPEDLVAYEHLDIGDLVGVGGFIFRTKKGEISIHCKEFKILCKTLEPLPEKFHGLTDVETKYRHRHLDLIMSEESRAVFAARSKIIREVRRFLDDRGFMEVETPMLQPVYGGAAAVPFTTHHRALDMKLFLKISPELYLKRLIVGGFEKVYDLNRNFRNEGVDRSHNPEFTMLEWYESYTDYKYQLIQFEDLVSTVAKNIKGSTKFQYRGRDIDFTTPWRRMTVCGGIQDFTGLDVLNLSVEQLREKLSVGFQVQVPSEYVHGDEPSKKMVQSESSPKDIAAMSFGECVMEIFELAVEEHIWHPTFVMDHPLEISPLTKKHRENPRLVERFEPFVAGMELGNAYTELNDPEDQYDRLKEQEAKRATDEEAQPMDEDFVHAIDVGMPPTGGVGMGIDRLVMVLTDQPSIRDIIFFPTMKFK